MRRDGVRPPGKILSSLFLKAKSVIGLPQVLNCRHKHENSSSRQPLQPHAFHRLKSRQAEHTRHLMPLTHGFTHFFLQTTRQLWETIHNSRHESPFLKHLVVYNTWWPGSMHYRSYRLITITYRSEKYSALDARGLMTLLISFFDQK